MIKKLLNPPSTEAGFTIIELMIATVVFSVVLLLCTFGLTRIGQTYYKGITTSRVQTAARSIADNLIQGIQYGGVPDASHRFTNSDGSQVICVGRGRYIYTVASAPNYNNTKLTYDEPAVCGTTTTNPLNQPRQLLSGGLRLSGFSVSLPDAVTGTVDVTVKVTAGDPDLFENGNPTSDFCKGGSGSQFCAVSNLATVVSPRL
jgi:prepilin-type N-terminal cleavage/methylation domain-containing protein